MCSQLAHSLRTILNAVMNFLLLIEDRIHNDKLVSISAASYQIIGLSEYYSQDHLTTHMKMRNMNLRNLKNILHTREDLSWGNSR